MPEPLEREVIFDIAPALSSLSDLDDAFQKSADNLRTIMGDALEAGLSGGQVSDIDASQVGEAVSSAIEDGADTPAVISDTDASAVESGVADAVVAGADEPAVVHGDASEVSDAIDAAVTSSDNEVVLQGNADEVASALNDAIGSVDTNVDVTASVTADTSDAEQSIEDLADLAANLDAEIPVTADTTEAQKNIEGLGQSAEGSSEGVGVLAGAVGGLTGKISSAGEEIGGGFGGALEAIGPAGIAAAGGVLVGTEALKKFTEIGAEVIGVEQQFAATFGDFGKDVEEIDVGGLNDDLRELAISLGVNDEAALSAATRAGALFKTFGAGAKEAAEFTKNLTAAAAVITSVNPAAGDLTTVLQSLTTAVATGRTRGLKRLGIEITPAEIEEAANAIGKTTDSLTATEKQAIFVDQIMTQLKGNFGDFGDEIATRQKNAQVQLAATRERIRNVIEEFSVQVAPPILDAIQELTPALESLIPLAKFFGKALAEGIKFGVDNLALLIGAIGQTAVALGNFIEAANQIPFVGRAIPDDVGDKIRDWGHGALESAQNMHDGAHAAADFSVSATGAGSAAEGAAGGIDGMGTAAGELTPEMQAANDALNAYVDTAVGKLPTATSAVETFGSSVSKAYGDVASAATDGGKKLGDAQDALAAASDPQRFVENLQAQAQAVRDWRVSLETISDAGFGDLLSTLIDAGPEQGAQLAASLAQGIRDGKPDVAKAAEEAIGTLRSEVDATGVFISGPGATTIRNATGLAADAGTLGWTERFKLQNAAATEADAAQALLVERGKAISTITGDAADQASVAYAEKFLIRNPTGKEVTATEDTITGSSVPGDAGTLGTDASGQYGAGLDLKTPTSAATQQAAQTLLTPGGQLQVAALSAGRSVGQSFTAGIAEGIANPLETGRAKGAARALVDAVEGAAREQAHSTSPSKLFAELGADLVAGLAIGIAEDDSAARAMRESINQVSSVISDASLPSLAVGGTGTLAPSVGANVAGTQTNSFNFDVTVNVDGNMTQTQARTIGAQIADSAQVELLRRNVVARVRAAV